MPRNPGTGIYTLPPGTGGTPNQPILSAMFNTFVGDFEQDANGARPLNAGGTGATNASGARTNLGLGTAAVKNTGTSGDAVPLLNAANTWAAVQTFSVKSTFTLGASFAGGIDFGASVVTTPNDTSRHIQLHTSGGGYGFSVSAGSLNYMGSAHNWYVAGGTTPLMTLSNTGSLTMAGSLDVASGGTGAKTATAARTNLGLGSAATRNTGTSGTNVPLLDGTNTWSGVQTFTSNPIIQNTAPLLYFKDTTSGSYDSRLLFDANNFYIQGSADGSSYSTKIQFEMDTNNVYFGTSGGNALIWNGTAVPLNVGGTGSTTASGARTNLGLAIGSNVQAYDAALQAISGLAFTDGGFIVGTGTTFAIESGSTARASLGLGGLSTLDLSDLVYSGSSSTNTSFPVTTTIAVYTDGTLYNLGATVTIRLGSAADFYSLGSGTVVSGTWRCRGTISGERQFFQRVS